MNWTEILGLIGGGAGIVALIKAGIDIYNAKSNRTTVDISNMEKMLNDSISRYERLETKFDEFQKKSHEYVEGLRGRILGIETRCQKQEERINNMEKVINLAWRCDYAPQIEDCPVIKEYERRKLCEGCEHHKDS
jgi:hypothetical protein